MNNFNRYPYQSHSVLGAEVKALSREEIDGWLSKITWVWEVHRVSEVRRKSYGGGILIVAELASPLRLHLGIGKEGTIDLCALFQEEQCVMWDGLTGFCSMWEPLTTQEADDFDVQMKLLIRRNCFLLGAWIETTKEERQEWILWLARQTDSKQHMEMFA